MSALLAWLRPLFASEEGQDLIEYALIIGLLVVAAILGLSALGVQIGSLWTVISTWLNNVAQHITP